MLNWIFWNGTCFCMLNWIVLNRTIFNIETTNAKLIFLKNITVYLYKIGFGFNNIQRSICHKPKQTNKKVSHSPTLKYTHQNKHKSVNMQACMLARFSMAHKICKWRKIFYSIYLSFIFCSFSSNIDPLRRECITKYEPLLSLHSFLFLIAYFRQGLF